jgi:hypothetical protein
VGGPSANRRTAVDTIVDGKPLEIARGDDGTWYVRYGGRESTGRSLMRLLEDALGPRHPQVLLHGLDALQMSSAADAPIARERDEA